MIAILVYFTLLFAILGWVLYTIRKSITGYTDSVSSLTGSLENSIPIDWEIMKENQIPIITFTFQNGQKYTFLVDSGANNSYLSDTVLEDFDKSQIIMDDTNRFFGIDGVERSSDMITLSFTHRNSKFTEIFMIADLSLSMGKMSDIIGKEVHGIIGVSFLKKYGMSIDLNRMLVWKRL